MVMNQNELAHRYFVNDLPEAGVPATRLRNILDRMQQGGHISAMALTYLQQKGLVALQQLARGETTYKAFCEVAVAERAAREQAAEADRREKAAERGPSSFRVEPNSQNRRS